MVPPSTLYSQLEEISDRFADAVFGTNSNLEKKV